MMMRGRSLGVFEDLAIEYQEVRLPLLVFPGPVKTEGGRRSFWYLMANSSIFDAFFFARFLMQFPHCYSSRTIKKLRDYSRGNTFATEATIAWRIRMYYFFPLGLNLSTGFVREMEYSCYKKFVRKRRSESITTETKAWNVGWRPLADVRIKRTKPASNEPQIINTGSVTELNGVISADIWRATDRSSAFKMLLAPDRHCDDEKWT